MRGLLLGLKPVLMSVGEDHLLTLGTLQLKKPASTHPQLNTTTSWTNEIENVVDRSHRLSFFTLWSSTNKMKVF